MYVLIIYDEICHSEMLIKYKKYVLTSSCAQIK